MIGSFGTALVVAVAGLVLAATPAEATPGNCFNATGGTQGYWTTAHPDYDFGRGGWCIYDPERPYYRLVFQGDGNLVAYDNLTANNPKNAVWSSRTNGRGTHIRFQRDGNVVVYNAAGSPLWSTGWDPYRTGDTWFRMNMYEALAGGGEYLTVTAHNPGRTLYDHEF